MAPGKRKGNKAISYILRIAVAVGALYLAFRGENLSQVAKGLSEIRLWVFALAMLVYIGGQLVFVVRWSRAVVSAVEGSVDTYRFCAGGEAAYVRAFL